jgi:hypothetical protein
VDVNFTLQLPVPEELRVIVQLVFAPLIVTRPEGMVEPPVTLTLTLTFAFTREGSGISAVMVVVVVLGDGRATPHKLNGEE